MKMSHVLTTFYENSRVVYTRVKWVLIELNPTVHGEEGAFHIYRIFLWSLSLKTFVNVPPMWQYATKFNNLTMHDNVRECDVYILRYVWRHPAWKRTSLLSPVRAKPSLPHFSFFCATVYPWKLYKSSLFSLEFSRRLVPCSLNLKINCRYWRCCQCTTDAAWVKVGPDPASTFH